MSELTRLTLAEAREGLKAKSFTARELTDAFLVAVDAAKAEHRVLVSYASNGLAAEPEHLILSSSRHSSLLPTAQAV